ncbi:MAG TPA: 50S ribosomal protein L19 [Candidatus Megaira endosymbiont of Nemacystus decipiens]|nr:50S ribosomal protein L19 [Candidatus Megaera endosymbiont of Nemacystus decipiens]
MTNIVEQFEQDQIKKMVQNKEIPDFRAGDTVRVSVRVVDGANERIQAYEGVVIARRNRGIASSFVVRKTSHNEGVERKFMIYSPIVAKIEVKKRGIVRRAKLHYLRYLSARNSRIRERRFVS